MRFFLALTFFIGSLSVNAQKHGYVWCFGDSAGIDFNNLSNPQPYFSVLRSKGSCASYSDSSGYLLCYAATSPFVPSGNTKTVVVYNKYNQPIQNGDSIIGFSWFYELILLPYPNQSNLLYLFSLGVTSDYGLYYSIIDLNQNGGFGAVIQKNIQLLSYQCSDGLSAVKHANGRDWWMLFRRGYLPTNEFYIYLLTPSGIQGPNITAIGSLSNSANLRQIFSPDGSKLMIINYSGLIELFDFDRCTGLPSNPVTIDIEYCCPQPNYWSGEFSSDGNFFYISNTNQDSCFLMQLDLQSSDISGTRDTIYVYTYPPSYYSEGQIKRGPDNKIYIANCYYSGVIDYYPYQDSMYTIYNQYISVINSPDSPGVSCNFQPYSFYLGGKRSYLGLPNNSDYDLGPVSGSICDSLPNEIIDPQLEKAELNVYYNSGWKTAFINAKDFKGSNYLLKISDIKGSEVFYEKGVLITGYFTKNLNCENFANGVYFVSLTTKKGIIVKRFVKE